MSVLFLLLPLFSFLGSGLFGRYFGRKFSYFFPVFCIFFTFLFSLFISFEVFLSSTKIFLYSWCWLNLIEILFNFGLLFDSLTCAMIIIITGISFFVHVFSVDYMAHDPHITRFMSYLSLFTFFMLVLVTADNFLQMFIGWEGVGLCSYLLINFWSTRILANKAALKAMIMNRVADILFVLGILLLIIYFKTTSYIIIFDLLHFVSNYNYYFIFMNIKLLDIISFFIFIGSIGKSAQLMFHTWLPDAMEGPTPVSSLLHAATMVTAGVFLIIRCSPIFEYSPLILMCITLIGGFTAFFSALIGFFQYDIKKIIAYSTCSQLGYMFFSCGLSIYNVAIFHLFNHAFFKALLFLSAGAIIHMLFDEQDLRKMGYLLNYLSFPFFTLFLGSIAIMGFPFLAGFYSKDILLESAFGSYILDSFFVYFLGISAAFLTAAYSFRLIIFVFFFFANGFRIVYYYLRLFLILFNDVTLLMGFSMFSLSLFSIFVGYLFSDLFLGYGSFLWIDLLYIKFINFTNIEIISDFLNPIIKNIPLFFSIFGCIFSFVIIYFFDNNNFYNYYYQFIIKIWYNISLFIYNGFFFNFIYDLFFLSLFKKSYLYFVKNLDKGFLEYIGPYGFFRFFKKFSFDLIFLDSLFFFSNIARVIIYLIILTLFLTSNFNTLMCIFILIFILLYFNKDNYEVTY